MPTIYTTSAMIQEAYQEALNRYKGKGDVEGALIFFSTIIGLYEVKVTEEDIEWANEIMVNRHNLLD